MVGFAALGWLHHTDTGAVNSRNIPSSCGTAERGMGSRERFSFVCCALAGKRGNGILQPLFLLSF